MTNSQYNQEIDLSKALKNVLRKWPLLMGIILIWLLIASFFIKIFPPIYESKLTILVEEPQRMNDPLRYVVGPQDFNPPEDEFFVNEKVIVKSYPMVRKTLDSLNAMVAYKIGGVFKRDIYKNSPIEVEIQPVSGKTKDQILSCQLLIGLEKQGGAIIESVNCEDESISPNEFVPFGKWHTVGDVQLKFSERKGATIEDLEQLWVYIEPIHSLVIDKMDDLDVEAPDFQSTVMEITLLGNNPVKDVEFLNLLGSIYLDNHLSSKTEMLRKSMLFLENELELSDLDMENSEQKLVTFKSSNEITDLSAESKILLAQTTKYQNEKLALTVSRKYYNYLKNLMEDNERLNHVITPQAFGVNDELTNTLVSQLVSLQKRKDNYDASGNTSNPIYQTIINEIDDLKKDILENVNGFVSSNEIRLQDVNQKIAELSFHSKNIPAEERALLQLNREYELNREILQDLQKKKFDVELSIASTIPDFEIIEPAYLTDTDPVFPNTIITYGAAVFLAFSSFFFWLLITGLFTNTIKSKDDIKVLNGESVIHNIFKSNIRNAVELRDYPLSILGENIKGILTHFNINNDRGRGIMGIYSHSPKEGKTYIASQMATMLALNGHKTVLVDLDLQNPNVHKQFMMDSETGASEYFAGEANREEIIRTTEIDNLKLITGGKYRLLQIPQGQVSKLLNQLSNEFDYIILDTSPVGMDASMRSVMTYCDMNYFVLTQSQTRKESIEQISEIVSHVPKQKLNYIFNKAPFAESHFKTYQNYYRDKPRSLFSRLFSWT